MPPSKQLFFVCENRAMAQLVGCKSDERAWGVPIPDSGARRRVCPSYIGPTRTPTGCGTPTVTSTAAPIAGTTTPANGWCGAAAAWSSVTFMASHVASVVDRPAHTLVCRSSALHGRPCSGVAAPITTIFTSATAASYASATARCRVVSSWSTTICHKSTRGHMTGVWKTKYGFVEEWKS